jgi:predicted sugar kinase
MVALHQLDPLVLDAEKPRDEAVQVRRGGDEQLGFLTIGEGGRIVACGAASASPSARRNSPSSRSSPATE